MKMLLGWELYIICGYVKSCEGCGCQNQRGKALPSDSHSEFRTTWGFSQVVYKQKVTSVSGRDQLTFAKSSCKVGNCHRAAVAGLG